MWQFWGYILLITGITTATCWLLLNRNKVGKWLVDLRETNAARAALQNTQARLNEMEIRLLKYQARDHYWEFVVTVVMLVDAVAPGNGLRLGTSLGALLTKEKFMEGIFPALEEIALVLGDFHGNLNEAANHQLTMYLTIKYRLDRDTV